MQISSNKLFIIINVHFTAKPLERFFSPKNLSTVIQNCPKNVLYSEMIKMRLCRKLFKHCVFVLNCKNCTFLCHMQFFRI